MCCSKRGYYALGDTDDSSCKMISIISLSVVILVMIAVLSLSSYKIHVDSKYDKDLKRVPCTINDTVDFKKCIVSCQFLNITIEKSADCEVRDYMIRKSGDEYIITTRRLNFGYIFLLTFSVVMILIVSGIITLIALCW